MKTEYSALIKTASTKEKAIKFFRALAAGVPFKNVAWGKSEREIKDYFALAAVALEKESRQGGADNET